MRAVARRLAGSGSRARSRILAVFDLSWATFWRGAPLQSADLLIRHLQPVKLHTNPSLGRHNVQAAAAFVTAAVPCQDGDSHWTLGCDAADPHRAAAFWAAALGYLAEPGYDDPDGASIIDPDGAGPAIGSLRVPEGNKTVSRTVGRASVSPLSLRMRYGQLRRQHAAAPDRSLSSPSIEHASRRHRLGVLAAQDPLHVGQQGGEQVPRPARVPGLPGIGGEAV